jgi:Flp pilus assembly protein TadD
MTWRPASGDTGSDFANGREGNDMDMQPKQDAKSELDRTREYLQQDPRNALLLAKAIELCLADGLIDEAAAFADVGRSTHRDDARLVNLHGHVLLAQGRLDEAVRVFEPLLARHSDPNVAYNLGLALHGLRRFAPARAVLAPHAERRGASVALITLYLRVLHHLVDMDAALQMMSAGRAAWPPDARLMAVMSLVYLDGDELGEAVRLSSMALATGERPLEALIVAASAALVHGEVAGARRLFDEVIRMHPTDPRSLLGSGTAALIAGDASLARARLTQALEAGAPSSAAAQMLAWSNVMLGDLDQARQILQSALQEDGWSTPGVQAHHQGNSASLCGAMAVVCAMQDDRDAGELWRDRAREIDASEFTIELASAILCGRPSDASRVRNHALRLLAMRRFGHR